MADFCKVCGIKLSSSNTVDYRPGSCRDCELERKKLYSGMSFDLGSAKKAKRLKKKLKGKKKTPKLKKLKKRGRKAKKKTKTQIAKLRKQKIAKAKKLTKLKKFRIERERKRKKLRQKIEKLRKLRIKKLLKLKQLKKKQKERDRKEKERIKLRIRKAKERERKLFRKERERLKREKEKVRLLIRQEKDRIRAAKKAEKDRIRAEKLRLRLEKQKEKERLKRSKEAAKNAIIQARESARKAAQEARRLREEAKKPPLVSVVTKVKEFQPPPNTRIIGKPLEDKQLRSPQVKKKEELKSLSIADAMFLESATTVPAKSDITGTQHIDKMKREAAKLKKDTDPIIDRYNPYSGTGGVDIPRAPSPTPWLTSSFKVVGGDFKETKPGEGASAQSGLSEDQVKEIIEKVKNEHKKTPPKS